MCAREWVDGQKSSICVDAVYYVPTTEIVKMYIMSLFFFRPLLTILKDIRASLLLASSYNVSTYLIFYMYKTYHSTESIVYSSDRVAQPPTASPTFLSCEYDVAADADAGLP